MTKEQLNEILEISTHAPHARRGLLGVKLHLLTGKFLLTRLMRGAAGQSVCPVSYTHLDVYKRQIYLRPEQL